MRVVGTRVVGVMVVGTRVVGVRVVGTRVVGVMVVGTRIVGVRVVGTRVVGVWVLPAIRDNSARRVVITRNACTRRHSWRVSRHGQESMGLR